MDFLFLDDPNRAPEAAERPRRAPRGECNTLRIFVLDRLMARSRLVAPENRTR